MQERVQGLQIKVSKYSSALGLKFERQDNRICFTFTRISAADPDRQFHLAMTLKDANTYQGIFLFMFSQLT